MKKARIISSVIAGILVAGVVSSSIALYTIKNEDKTFTIGGSVSGDGGYKLVAGTNNLKYYNADSDEVDGLQPNGTLELVYDLQFADNSSNGGKYSQDTNIGNLIFNITGDLKDYLKIKNAYVNYDDEKTTDTGSNNGGYPVWGSISNDTNIKGTSSDFAPLSTGADVAFTCAGGNELHIILEYVDTVTDDNFLEIAEKTFSYELSLGAPTTTRAILTGTPTSWSDDEKYTMAPDLAAYTPGEAGWKWTGILPSGEWKAKQGDTWAANNKTLGGDTSATYYWNGLSTGDVYTK